MGFVIEQACPQCGASLNLSETDRILSCPYCDVQSYLFSSGYFRYILPDKAPQKEIIYIPYLRFKGNVYFCSNSSIDHRIIDITQAGVDLKGIPASLGFRPQAMKARFAQGDTKGRFMKFTLKAADILAKAAKLTNLTGNDALLHRAFIGETMSIIYLPAYVEDERLYDAIVKKPIAESEKWEEEIDSRMMNGIHETVSFIPMLCPECGANMKGERESAVLLCDNCLKAWEVIEGKFIEIKMIISGKPHDDTVYLPFWKIIAKTKGVNIETYADFIGLTNQPLIIDSVRGSMPMSYFSPAFKIRPKLFINLARQFTIMQINEFTPLEAIPIKGIHPVTIPLSEAVQALKIILASTAVMKNNVLPYLPQISFETGEKTLIYIPFRKTRFDMINEEIGISINRQSLEFGMTL
jgi:hypothetical protein